MMIKDYNGTLFDTKVRPTFSDIYESAEVFFENQKDLFPNTFSEDNFNMIFYLLYARYGNSQVASTDLNQFNYQIGSTIFMYGPSWLKRLEVQKQIRELNAEDIKIGSKQIINHANNPSTTPTTSTLQELPFINDQMSQTWVKGDVEAYEKLWNMIETDVTKEFIDKFQKFFVQIPVSGIALYYESEE